MLHISDLHMTPQATARQRWVVGLAGLEPDLVINTGDNISHPAAGPYVLRSLGRLLDVPGVFVWGSNDYFVPTFKNPLRYLTERGRTARPGKRKLPWQDLGRAFTDAGWIDLTNTAGQLEIQRRPDRLPRDRRRPPESRSLRPGGRPDRSRRRSTWPSA